MNGMIPTGVDPADLVMLITAIVVLTISLATVVVVMMHSSGKGGNVPPGPAVRMRPPRDLKAIMKFAREQEEEMVTDG